MRLKSFLCRTFVLLGLLAPGTSASAEFIYGSDFQWEWIGEGVYLRGIYQMPVDGVLVIPETIQANKVGENSVVLPVLGSYVDIGRFEHFKSIKEIRLPKTFRYINQALGGLDLEDRGILQGGADDFRGIYVDPENPYFKSIEGMLLSKDGKELYAIPRESKEGKTMLIVPEKVEKCHIKRVESSISGYEAISLPESLKESATDFAGFRYIFINSSIPFHIPEPSKSSYKIIYNNQNKYGTFFVYVPKGSLDNYRSADHWKNIVKWTTFVETGMKDMSTENMVEVSFEDVPAGEISCKINGKSVRKLSVKPTERVEIEIANLDSYLLRENGELLDQDIRLAQKNGSIIFYPFRNTTFTVISPQEKPAETPSSDLKQ